MNVTQANSSINKSTIVRLASSIDRPNEFAETVILDNGESILLRPIRPGDEPAHREFGSHLTLDDLRMRFFRPVYHVSADQWTRFTHIDYESEMAFIASRHSAVPETLGVIRAVFKTELASAEVAIIVRSDSKGLGIGEALFHKMIEYCRQRGMRELSGQVLPHNKAMIKLARKLGFEIHYSRLDKLLDIRLPL